MDRDNLVEQIRSSSDSDLRNQFKYLEEHKDQVILFFEHTGDRNDNIIQILQKESFYNAILNNEFKGVAAWTPMDSMNHISKLIKIAYKDFKELELGSNTAIIKEP